MTGSAHFFFHLELLSSIIVGKYHKRGRRGFRNGTDHRISEFFLFKYRSQKEPTLKDINLAIYPGEKVLIVGPSGSGKSTLAHCINGLVPFSYAGDITGTYRIKGEDPAKRGIFGLSKSVGTVLQDTDGQFIGLTVAEDIAFALENDRVEYHEMRGRVDKAADAVDVKRPARSRAGGAVWWTEAARIHGGRAGLRCGNSAF